MEPSNGPIHRRPALCYQHSRSIRKSNLTSENTSQSYIVILWTHRKTAEPSKKPKPSKCVTIPGDQRIQSILFRVSVWDPHANVTSTAANAVIKPVIRGS